MPSGTRSHDGDGVRTPVGQGADAGHAANAEDCAAEIGDANIGAASAVLAAAKNCDLLLFALRMNMYFDCVCGC